MPLYEHTVIVRQDLSSQQAQTLAEQLAQLVVEQGGKVTKTEQWGLRNLSYRMRKNRKGHYVHLNLDATPAVVLELERNERINEDVLRYLTVKVDTVTDEPSAMMQARSSRDDRGGRRERGDRFDRGDRFERSDRGDRGERGDRGDRGERSDRGERERPQATDDPSD